MDNSDIKQQQHLINIIKHTRDHHPNFTVFLGAGASVTSGIDPAEKMIRMWREQYVEIFSPDSQAKLEKESWYDQDDEYSGLFEKLYDQSSQRREYIESCIAGKSPSWGYIYLVNLMSHDVFNTVFTSNFDDLLNEACYLYSSGLRPVVCAHDSSIKTVRITSKRPKIIKLHGDYLFDNIKNTSRELRNLDQNMEDKFRQYAPEFGLIVVGYAGNDESIMNCLESLLADKNNYPHGIYWCVRNRNEVAKQVRNLARYSGFNIIEIEGFDEFFADLHEALQFPLQSELSSPYDALKTRLNSFIEMSAIPAENVHSVISKDIQALSGKLQELEHIPQTPTEGGDVISLNRSELTPFMLIANAEYRSGNISSAQQHIKIYLQSICDTRSLRLGFETLSIVWNDQFAELLSSKFTNNMEELLKNDINLAVSAPLEMIKAKQYDSALELSKKAESYVEKFKTTESDTSYIYFTINYAQAYRFTKKPIPKNLETKLNTFIKNQHIDDIGKAGVYIALEEYDKAMGLIEHLLPNQILEFMDWPIAELIPEDLLVDFIDRCLKLDGNPNRAHDISIRFINVGKYDAAEKLLEVGHSTKSGTFNTDFYWLNKAQITLYRGKGLSEELQSEVRKILSSTDDIYTKMGCYIVLKNTKDAHKILATISDQRITAWPIVKLLDSSDIQENTKKSGG